MISAALPAGILDKYQIIKNAVLYQHLRADAKDSDRECLLDEEFEVAMQGAAKYEQLRCGFNVQSGLRELHLSLDNKFNALKKAQLEVRVAEVLSSFSSSLSESEAKTAARTSSTPVPEHSARG